MEHLYIKEPFKRFIQQCVFSQVINECINIIVDAIFLVGKS